MSAIAISIDAARDAAHRRHTDEREAYTARYESTSAAVYDELRAAGQELLSETLWSALDGDGMRTASQLHLLDAVLAAARDLTAVEYKTDVERSIAVARVINAYRIAEASAVVRIADGRMLRGAR
ncbi:MAG: hypothetical protein IPJ61_18515 [Tessaracoccus sp.]|uniref:hypothetical protein n=1 Tax=Tessaracoccus sp. TaxID=1971211 RepID=UPI001ED5863D|nr:hypothetical protein [Tessaracoccus sp.]MBK7822979.1 hypothetical protein [Tessaracoccus sp.]